MNGGKSVNSAVVQEGVEDTGHVMLSAKQFDQLLKLLPTTGSQEDNSDLESPFSGMAISTDIKHIDGSWIMDSGATDHMTSDLNLLSNVSVVTSDITIKLPTGDVAHISHIRDVKLGNGLILLGVLYVPEFHHNLLSIHKLALDNACQVLFYPTQCIIMSAENREIKGTGILQNGLYYLVDTEKSCNVAQTDESSYETWHNRLGHAPKAKILSIPSVKSLLKNVPSHMCVTCSLARFTKLPIAVSSSHAPEPFHLIHADIWGPYKVPTRGKYKHFLTLVDDYSRMVWVYLLQHKS